MSEIRIWNTEYGEFDFLASLIYLSTLVFQVSIHEVYLSAFPVKRLKYISQGLTLVELNVGFV